MSSEPGLVVRRNPTLATLLSLIVPGLGHIYLGRIVAGLGLLVAHVALGSIATIVVVAGLPSIGAVGLAAGPWCAVWLGGAVWANRSARRIPASPVLREFQQIYVYVLVGLLALPNILAWTMAVREHVAELLIVPSASMLPSITPGSRILINKLVYRKSPIHRGDRVVFVNPNARHTKYVKRVVALAGDVIEMQDDELLVNGKRLAYADVDGRGPGKQRIERASENGYPILLLTAGLTKPFDRDFAPQKVPNGHCFLLGDNRHQSEDSRVHGPVPLVDVVGRVEWVY